MVDLPETRYARAPDGAFIAFQVFGSGPIDVLLMPGFFTNLDENWRIPEIADTHRRIGAFARVIAMDRRGVGLSDRLSPGDGAPLETHVDDLIAVLDAVKARDVCSPGHERVWRAAAGDPFCGGTSRTRPGPCPVRADPEQSAHSPRLTGPTVAGDDRAVEMLSWGTVSFARATLNGRCRRSPATSIPSELGVPIRARRRALGRRLRCTSSGGQQTSGDVLSSVRAPTLILTRPNAAFIDLVQPFAAEIEMRVPGARTIELPGRDFPFYFGDRASFVAELEEFLPEPVLRPMMIIAGSATVMFTDIVDSTARSAGVGDRCMAGNNVSDMTGSSVKEIARYRGREIKTLGDGLLDVSMDRLARFGVPEAHL